MGTKMKMITVKVEEILREEAKAAAEKLGVGLSELVRDLLRSVVIQVAEGATSLGEIKLLIDPEDGGPERQPTRSVTLCIDGDVVFGGEL